MSTRGFVGYLVDGEVTLMYNHSDSYPSYLGTQVATFCDTMASLGEVPRFTTLARGMVRMPQQEKVSEDWQETLTTNGVAAREGDDWYGALRHIQGDLRAHLSLGVGPVTDIDWPKDSLFCEWGYLVNFDDLTLEVYRGFQTKPHSNGRFADFAEKPDEILRATAGNVYYPVALVATMEFGTATDEMEGLEERVALFDE